MIDGKGEEATFGGSREGAMVLIGWMMYPVWRKNGVAFLLLSQYYIMSSAYGGLQVIDRLDLPTYCRELLMRHTFLVCWSLCELR